MITKTINKLNNTLPYPVRILLDSARLLCIRFTIDESIKWFIVVFLYFELSEPNTMQAILGSLVAVSSFGVAYAAQLMFPVKPIQEADILLSQSTIGTVNILSKDELQSQQKTPRELIELYMSRKANLQDIIEIVSGKTGIRESYAQLKTMEQTPEIIFLVKSTERNYNITPEPETPPPSA